MILDSDLQRDWKPGEKRDTRVVFIGRNLDEGDDPRRVRGPRGLRAGKLPLLGGSSLRRRPPASAPAFVRCYQAPHPCVSFSGNPVERTGQIESKGRLAMNKLLVALGALAAGTLLLPDVAEAQRGGGFRGGGGAGFRGGGFGGGGAFRAGAGGFRGGISGPVGGFRGGAIGGRPGFRYGYGYRPVPFGGRGFGYGGRGYAYRPVYRGYYGRRYPYYGGAVAAGLIGGLALGALSYPYYGYGYPYGYGGAYYDAGYGEECWVRRRTIDQWGRVVVRLVQVCDY